LSISWDPNGNMLSKSNGYNFKYDFQNRLKEAINPGGLNITMVYDNFNRRVVKKYANSQQPSIIYIWEEDELIEEYNFINGNFKLSKQFIPGHSIDQKILATVDLDGDGQLETEYYFLQDQLGNIEALIDSTGKKMEEYEYSGYGNVKYYQPDNTKPLIEQVRINENGNLAILFTEPILENSINSENVQLKDPNNQPVNGNWSIDEEKRQITFDTPLTESQNYSLTVQNVYDLNTNKIDNYSKTFVAQANSRIEDTKNPEIEMVYNDNGNLIVTFTEDLKPETVNQNSIILKRNGNAVAGTTEMVNSRTLKFITAQSLIVNLDYELTIDPNLKDLADKPVNQQLINFTYLDLPISFYSKQNQRTEISTTAYSNFHLFQGREYDKELDLYYFRNRYLDPELKIWITKDPEEYADAYNLYQAFAINFINNSDPKGNRLNIFINVEDFSKEYSPKDYAFVVKRIRENFLKAGIKNVYTILDNGDPQPAYPEIKAIDKPIWYFSKENGGYLELLPHEKPNTIWPPSEIVKYNRKKMMLTNNTFNVWLKFDSRKTRSGISGLHIFGSTENSISKIFFKFIKDNLKDEKLNIEQLLTLFSNIATHEIGHLFGLYIYDDISGEGGFKGTFMQTKVSYIDIINANKWWEPDAYHLRQIANTPQENLEYDLINREQPFDYIFKQTFPSMPPLQ
jgi:RHS repeat-associated protein